MPQDEGATGRRAPVPPTAWKILGGVGAGLVTYALWCGFIVWQAAEAGAAQRADPDPAPDDATLTTGFLYLLMTPCVVAPFVVVGVGSLFSRRTRPFGIALTSTLLAPFAIVVAYLVLVRIIT